MRIYREPKRLVGVDIFQPYLNFCEKFNLYDEVYCLDLRKLPFPLKSKDFDVVTCIELLEHLPRKDGEKLLEEIERLAKLVIVTTSTTFFSQRDFNHNPFQKHMSSWTLADFRKRNYHVKGFGDFLIRRKGLSTSRLFSLHYVKNGFHNSVYSYWRKNELKSSQTHLR